MISYELAKQLEDAGFPKPEHYNPDVIMRGAVYSPSLLDLIEACETGFKFELVKAQLGWFAKTRGCCSEYGCETPEEAVAKLWLELNKPNDK